MYHPALSPLATKALSRLLTDDNRINVLAARLESSCICPDRIVYHRAPTFTTSDLLAFHYGKRALYFSGDFSPITGFVFDSHTQPPFTPREATYTIELVPPMLAYFARPFILRSHK